MQEAGCDLLRRSGGRGVVPGDKMLYDKCAMANKNFKEVEHTADVALWVHGDTLPDLFINAAQGMYSLMVVAMPVHVAVERVVKVTGIDLETLLVNWLGELLYYTEVEGVVFGQFEIVELEPERLHAVARGQVGVPLGKLIKAVTFHDLNIALTDEGYQVTIVFDV